MQFIIYQSHNESDLSITLFFSICPPLLSTSSSSLACSAPTLLALDFNRRSLCYCFVLFSPLSFTAPSQSVCLAFFSLLADVGRWDHITFFLASLVSGGSDNDGKKEGWGEKGEERGGMEWCSTAGANDCIRQPLYITKALKSDIFINDMLRCASSSLRKNLHLGFSSI